MGRFLHRIIGAAALNAAIYEEVEHDSAATRQAFTVVMLAGSSAAVASRGWTGVGAADLGLFEMLAMLAWAAWALVTYEIGAWILPELQTRVDVPELLRTIGFAAAPGILFPLSLIRGWTIPVLTVIAVWMLLTMIVAVRQALDYRSTGRAIAVCVLGWTLTLGCLLIIGFFFGPRIS